MSQWSRTAGAPEIVLMGEGSMARMIPAGRSTIHPAPMEGPHCSLVPLQRPATVTASGLRWNMSEPP